MHPSVKLILSFLAGVYYWRSLTPPNPPAASKEKISTDGLFGRTIRSSAVLAKVSSVHLVLETTLTPLTERNYICQSLSNRCHHLAILPDILLQVTALARLHPRSYLPCH